MFKREIDYSSKTKLKRNYGSRLYWSAMASACAFMTSTQMVMGEDMWDKVSNMAQGIYAEIVTVSTSIAAVVIVIALLMRMFSANSRSIEVWTSWAKRAGVSWLLINGLGYIVAYGKTLIEGAPAIQWT